MALKDNTTVVLLDALRRPSETPAHQIVVSGLARRLDALAVKGGGLVLTAPLDTALADHTIVQPDIVYVAGERIAEIVADRIEGAPDLVVEVLSPSTIRRDRGEKLRAYAEFGVGEYWLVDPCAPQIDFLVNHAGRFEVALALDGIYRSGRYLGLELDLVGLWQEIEDRLAAIGEAVGREQDDPGTPEGCGGGMWQTTILR